MAKPRRVRFSLESEQQQDDSAMQVTSNPSVTQQMSEPAVAVLASATLSSGGACGHLGGSYPDPSMVHESRECEREGVRGFDSKLATVQCREQCENVETA